MPVVADAGAGERVGRRVEQLPCPPRSVRAQRRRERPAPRPRSPGSPPRAPPNACDGRPTHSTPSWRFPGALDHRVRARRRQPRRASSRPLAELHRSRGPRASSWSRPARRRERRRPRRAHARSCAVGTVPGRGPETGSPLRVPRRRDGRVPRSSTERSSRPAMHDDLCGAVRRQGPDSCDVLDGSPTGATSSPTTRQRAATPPERCPSGSSRCPRDADGAARRAALLAVDRIYPTIQSRRT